MRNIGCHHQLPRPTEEGPAAQQNLQFTGFMIKCENSLFKQQSFNFVSKAPAILKSMSKFIYVSPNLILMSVTDAVSTAPFPLLGNVMDKLFLTVVVIMAAERSSGFNYTGKH